MGQEREDEKTRPAPDPKLAGPEVISPKEISPKVISYIGLGSNLGDGVAALQQALQGIADLPGTELLRVSSFYRTAAWGKTDQPDFTNGVAEIITCLQADELLQQLLALELDLGRVRNSERWGPRCIDLDILSFADQVIDLPDLTTPHPRMHERAFVLLPLLELEPAYRIPGLGEAGLFLEKVSNQRIEKIK